jgi:VWFA-related protein
MKAPQLSTVRRAIILVSDGEDNSSHVTREEAIEMALRANTIVYTISTNFPSGGSGDKVLQRIAEATGGRAFEPFQLTDVANAFAQIQDDLRSQYELSYRPESFVHDGRYRTIAISALHKGLKVRSRSGYYAPVE